MHLVDPVRATGASPPRRAVNYISAIHGTFGLPNPGPSAPVVPLASGLRVTDQRIRPRSCRRTSHPLGHKLQCPQEEAGQSRRCPHTPGRGQLPGAKIGVSGNPVAGLMSIAGPGEAPLSSVRAATGRRQFGSMSDDDPWRQASRHGGHRRGDRSLCASLHNTQHHDRRSGSMAA